MTFNLQIARRADVLPLFEAHHGYKSLGKFLTYCFSVVEGDRVVAAYVWQPPAPNAAKTVCPEAPWAVLSLSRMVAIPKDERALKHISKPLRVQQKKRIDRTRWPVLVTYSDEGLGHNGYVYQCSGWTPTEKRAARVYEDEYGARCSSYSNGKSGSRAGLSYIGETVIQRWEHWACLRGSAAWWLEKHGWRRVPIPGKVWASGNAAHRFVREA